MDPATAAGRIRASLPAGGLFADLNWRIATAPFLLTPAVAEEIETLGRVLMQFYRAANLLYRRSVDGKAPAFVAAWLDQGKPAELIALQRDPAFKNDLPRVIRPDLLITDDGLAITELDSVPGGIGLTTWLYATYENVGWKARPSTEPPADLDGGSPLTTATPALLGSAREMRDGFHGIFGEARRIHVIVSEESATYRPEMEWLAESMTGADYRVAAPDFTSWEKDDAVYRFFELFDLPNVPAAWPAFDAARRQGIRLTPPPKPIFEEKLLFGLLWNRHLRAYWRQEMGEAFLNRLLRLIPYTWVVDPTPIPPHAAIPELGLTDWQQLKNLSQRERELILKISGFSAEAWGARGVALGSDLNATDWAVAIDRALASWPSSPYVLQRFQKPGLVQTAWFDFDRAEVIPMDGRARLCPYYFVHGDADAARPVLGGVLATLCPPDKKIIHGMRDGVLAPCQRETDPAARNDRPARIKATAQKARPGAPTSPSESRGR